MRVELRKMRKRYSSMELTQRHTGYRVEEYNVIIDVLGGYPS